mgnify:CR=1 FL=1|jgi:biotin-(acetyl-CoA carboxylase) ligase
MLTRKHFIDFADLLIDLQIKGKSISIKDLTSEIMLILDKNSLRFNKYQFKNYINTRIEKRLNNIENDIKTKLNKVG